MRACLFALISWRSPACGEESRRDGSANCDKNVMQPPPTKSANVHLSQRWSTEVPDAVFERIVLALQQSTCRAEEVGVVRRVCKAWKQTADKHITKADLHISHPALGPMLLKFRHLRQLRICSFDTKLQIKDQNLAHLGDLPLLSHLELQACHKLNGTGFAVFSKLLRLTVLHLEELSNLKDHWMLSLAGLKLTSLHVECCAGTTDEGLQVLQSLPALEKLGLSACPLLTDAGIGHLQRAIRLQDIDIWGCRTITGATLGNLRRITGLASLRVANCESLTDQGLQTLSKCSQLSSLTSLSCGLSASASVTNAALQFLSKLTQLQKLEIREPWGGSFSDSGLENIQRLTSLHELKLDSWRKLTDSGLSTLYNLTSLRLLQLSDCTRLTSASLAHVLSLQSLEVFYCFGSGIKRCDLPPHHKLREVVIL